MVDEEDEGIEEIEEIEELNLIDHEEIDDCMETDNSNDRKCKVS